MPDQDFGPLPVTLQRFGAGQEIGTSRSPSGRLDLDTVRAHNAIRRLPTGRDPADPVAHVLTRAARGRRSGDWKTKTPVAQAQGPRHTPRLGRRSHAFAHCGVC
jgi:hypothetical protein